MSSLVLPQNGLEEMKSKPGPRTLAGKARVSLNALKHRHYAQVLTASMAELGEGILLPAPGAIEQKTNVLLRMETRRDEAEVGGTRSGGAKGKAKKRMAEKRKNV